jgi:hypothetical protein
MVRWDDGMRLASQILCAAALASCPAPAMAADAGAAGAPELAAAFRAICLDHLGNARAQAAAALAAPWTFSPEGRTADDEARFRSALGALSIREAAGFCALTGEVDPRLDVAAFQAAMRTSLPFSPGQPMESPDSVYWLIAADGGGDQYVIALMVSSQTGTNLATLTHRKREMDAPVA